MRFSRQGWAVIAALVLVAMVSQVSLAQREEGRRGRGGPGGGMFGPPTAGRLLGLKEVQDALKLTDDQKGRIEEINDKMREEMREAFQGGFDREKMMKITTDTSEKINEVLDDGQEKRLMGIMIQVNGAAAIADPAVAKELNITDDQKSKMQEIRTGVREEFEKLRDQDLSREERGKKFEEIQADLNKKVLAELTSDQQAQLEKLKGEKVEIDMAQLRGRGGLGDRQRGERGERRGDRNPEQNEEKLKN
jgi:Spy/CpxP family protein refolding chaperone